LLRHRHTPICMVYGGTYSYMYLHGYLADLRRLAKTVEK
jgi:hypothetical protein